jgi:hypothetical protein
MRSLLFRSTALFIVIVLAACGQPPTVEQQIIATIEEMDARIEAGERRAFMQNVAEDFNGQDGSMNRDQVRALVVFQLNRYKQLQARLFPIRVEDNGDDTARAEFRALVTGGPNWIPESGQVYAFETTWRNEGGDWLLTSANWDPVPLEEVLPLPGD